MADVRLIPCLSDNYAVLIHDGDETILVDAPEAAPIRAVLDETGWALTTILITHHHADHVQAIEALRGNARVIGPAAEAGKIAGLDETIEDGQSFSIGPVKVEAMATPGHTAGPLSYHMPELGIAFTGDTLFAMGCGRLFEGTPADMWASFQRLRDALPDATRIYCGHEYTLTNARFGAQTLPEDAAITGRLAEVKLARDRDEPTIPTTMALEKATNPFMRADDPSIAAALGMSGAAPVDVFAKLRQGRDGF